MTKEQLKTMFAAYTPSEQQQEAMKDIRQAAYRLAGTILVSTVASAKQTVAIRKVQEAMMWATQAVCQSSEVV